ncbi:MULTISPECIES: hypothetical protein [Salinicola]|jgi:hypothetical protein|uniref:hypothetical protein n=1 Tax=Salinicola TaxID=404432 RepID=UPI0008DD8B2D|nr:MULTISPECIES: hypothetical protein [Salinicola]MDF3917603.1 hypothetical protein [Salinicola salarius]OHY97478.1 hypothetical protein BC443_17260 [Salinicola sp. MIT1003]
MQPPFRRLIAGAVVIGLILPLTGCGTLFYPERKGQLQGRIDPGVAIADGLGLLLFIVPGVIAYAVDFSNNTIYLPGSHEASIDRVHYEGNLSADSLASMIETRTGHDLAAEAQAPIVERVATLDQAVSRIEFGPAVPPPI